MVSNCLLSGHPFSTLLEVKDTSKLNSPPIARDVQIILKLKELNTQPAGPEVSACPFILHSGSFGHKEGDCLTLF